jgi:hypothetical protein
MELLAPFRTPATLDGFFFPPLNRLLKYSVAGVFDPGILAGNTASQWPATILQQAVKPTFPIFR